MITCRIRLGFGPGLAGIAWTSDFPSTCDALIAALNRFPDALRISVRAV